MPADHRDPADEFATQVGGLIDLGYSSLTATSGRSFADEIAALTPIVPALPESPPGRIPFVIVVPTVAPEVAMPLARQGTKRGFVKLDPHESAAFRPIDSVMVPAHPYLLVDVDTGAEFFDVAPEAALPVIESRGRSPLTIHEGVAVITAVPGVLRSHSSFSLLASRSGDRRVPALWLSGGAPRLGWCWDGAPHSWLGSASCAARVSAG